MKKVDKFGHIYWYKEKDSCVVLHREDGPAVEYAHGDKVWYKEGKIHRENGPAREYTDGYKEYWLHGIYLEDIKSDEELIIKVLLE